MKNYHSQNFPPSDCTYFLDGCPLQTIDSRPHRRCAIFFSHPVRAAVSPCSSPRRTDDRRHGSQSSSVCALDSRTVAGVVCHLVTQIQIQQTIAKTINELYCISNRCVRIIERHCFVEHRKDEHTERPHVTDLRRVCLALEDLRCRIQ